MTKLYLYRESEYQTPEESAEDGALYETELDNDVGIRSMAFRDCLCNINLVISLADQTIGGGSNLKGAIKHPETDQFISIDDYVDWSYAAEVNKPT